MRSPAVALQDAYSLPPAIHRYSRLGAVRIFKKQGAVVDSGENSAVGSGVTPSLFFSRMAASAFIQDA